MRVKKLEKQVDELKEALENARKDVKRLREDVGDEYHPGGITVGENGWYYVNTSWSYWSEPNASVHDRIKMILDHLGLEVKAAEKVDKPAKLVKKKVAKKA